MEPAILLLDQMIHKLSALDGTGRENLHIHYPLFDFHFLDGNHDRRRLVIDNSQPVNARLGRAERNVGPFR